MEKEKNGCMRVIHNDKLLNKQKENTGGNILYIP